MTPLRIRRSKLGIFVIAALSTAAACWAKDPKNAGPKPILATVTAEKNGQLHYTADASGDRIPDYSYAGYQAGAAEIPNAPIRAVVPPIDGDNTTRIQSAIDYVSKLPPDEHGLRGAVLLTAGRYSIAGGLHIGASGVVLRGSGGSDKGTILIGTTTDRQTLITLQGADLAESSAPLAATDTYIPAGAMQLHVSSASNLKVGDTIFIRRPCTAAWIAVMRMRDLDGEGSGWKPGSRELVWDRTITAINGDQITLDAPITDALDSRYGGGTVTTYQWPNRLTNVGVENLSCDSTFDPANPKDEAHRWIAIEMINARDGWVRQVSFSHFAGSAVTLLASCSRITVEDCKSLDPVSEIGGSRRNTFFTNGQQTLFQRCYSEHGRHDFSVGNCAAGPNSFVQCEARQALGDSGPIDSWAAGVLYDNVRIDGAALRLDDLRNKSQFAGWGAANCLIWQSNASLIRCFDPPTAHNWCYASWGMFDGDSAFTASDNNLPPPSLYYGQLAARIGSQADARAQMLPIDMRSSRNPTVQNAAQATADSVRPPPQLSDWINAAAQRNPIPTDANGAKSIDEIRASATTASAAPPHHHIHVANGWLTLEDGTLVTGGRQSIKWWRGGIRPDEVAEATKDGPNPTRYVPGRTGPGLTDDLAEIASQMQAHHRAALDYHYGLWYDTRDVDHERVRRIDGDVWPPFYEMPFARSGIGTEWDGLSQYDLYKYNPWYWSRLKQFADLCDQRGLVLFNNDFFQHNILEAGAHWASCPWRSANNINHTDFPEPPPYAGDKLIFMAQQFYDVTNPVRTAIYRAYIRQCLNNFADNSNVIQFTSAEFTGPTAFTQFWLDTIAQWEKDTGRKPIIGLAAPKNVQDAILADPARAAVISVIDIRYWWYQAGGKIYAPPGGENLTPRQWMREGKPRMPDFESAARAVKEYRQRFPEKAVLLGPEDGSVDAPWAVVMAGGSLPDLPGVDPALLKAIPRMRPVYASKEPGGPAYLLSEPGRNYLAYFTGSDLCQLDLSAAPGTFSLHWIDPRTNGMIDKPNVSGGTIRKLQPPGHGAVLAWLSRTEDSGK